MAKIAKNDPLPGKTRPNTTINGAAAKLNTGISQAHSILKRPHRRNPPNPRLSKGGALFSLHTFVRRTIIPKVKSSVFSARKDSAI